jgi:excinuclease ABC subunit B
MDDLLTECKAREDRNERILVTTLTKRLAEDLTEYLQDRGVPTRYLHSDIDTLERVSIIHSLRQGDFSVLVGINLLREGLDIPEVSLVAILDADKEGFLRSARSLIQTFGRASRNVNGTVLLYADTITKSMRSAMEETERRRKMQLEFNKQHSIVPQTIFKDWSNPLYAVSEEAKQKAQAVAAEGPGQYSSDPKALAKRIAGLERQMRQAAQKLEFEKAADLRDTIASLREMLVSA